MKKHANIFAGIRKLILICCTPLLLSNLLCVFVLALQDITMKIINWFIQHERHHLETIPVNDTTTSNSGNSMAKFSLISVKPFFEPGKIFFFVPVNFVFGPGSGPGTGTRPHISNLITFISSTWSGEISLFSLQYTTQKNHYPHTYPSNMHLQLDQLSGTISPS